MSNDLGPAVEVGPFHCIYEDDRWDEPEIIVDPVTGFVVAIFPRRPRSVRPLPAPGPRRWHVRTSWRERLSRWLFLTAASRSAGRGAREAADGI
jgi:hypothetical protein